MNVARRALLLSVPAFAAILATACGTDPAPPAVARDEAPVSTAARTDPAYEACVRLVEALGSRRARCIGADGPSMKLSGASGAAIECETVAAAAAAGRVTVDPSEVPACAAEVGQASCATDATWSLPPTGPCARAMQRAGEGGACVSDLECGGHAYCDADGPFCGEGICRARAGVAQPCAYNVGCAYGLMCGSAGGRTGCWPGVVVPRPATSSAGEPCGPGLPACAIFTSCGAEGRCDREPRAGEPCSGACVDGFCDGAGICQAYRALGDVCSPVERCGNWLRCAPIVPADGGQPTHGTCRPEAC